ncbi:hypothetical protein DFQ28_007143 [Apophysomyces sp. BC1034]|nr:hypothetical protein DFQ30_007020 [Apophysomyces sp. BC1015]KAG0176547.1 hypothetical protein DFQ29_005980 [Apophysomyces sp. BC1021]KAG0186914.1 hypothetical protein DFQ28_007143 [Apophysomyces sp. BC1034]
MEPSGFANYLLSTPFSPAQGRPDRDQAHNAYGHTFKIETAPNHYANSMGPGSDTDSMGDMNCLQPLTNVCDPVYASGYARTTPVSDYDWFNSYLDQWTPKHTDSFYSERYIIDATVRDQTLNQQTPLFEDIFYDENNTQPLTRRQSQEKTEPLLVAQSSAIAMPTTSSQAITTPTLSAVQSPSTVATLSPIMHDITNSPPNYQQYPSMKLFFEEDGLLLKPERKRLHCKFCKKTFKRCQERKRHERTHTHEKPFRCLHCSKPFSRKDALTRHNKTHTNTNRKRPNRHWQQSMQL